MQMCISDVFHVAMKFCVFLQYRYSAVHLKSAAFEHLKIFASSEILKYAQG